MIRQQLLCIDPGPRESGVVIYDGKNINYTNPAFNNYALLEFIKLYLEDPKNVPCTMAIESIVGYGKAVGVSTFDTAEWVGIFRHAFGLDNAHKISRKDIKLHICGSIRAKGKDIRYNILKMFPATGGGKTPEIGTKKKPGPLYGVTSHGMSALAVGITYLETKHE